MCTIHTEGASCSNELIQVEGQSEQFIAQREARLSLAQQPHGIVVNDSAGSQQKTCAISRNIVEYDVGGHSHHVGYTSFEPDRLQVQGMQFLGFEGEKRTRGSKPIKGQVASENPSYQDIPMESKNCNCTEAPVLYSRIVSRQFDLTEELLTCIGCFCMGCLVRGVTCYILSEVLREISGLHMSF